MSFPNTFSGLYIVRVGDGNYHMARSTLIFGVLEGAALLQMQQPILDPHCHNFTFFALFAGVPQTDSEDSSRNKLPLMILSPPEQTRTKMGFPVGKCIFLQGKGKTFSCRKNAVSCRKMPFPAEKMYFPPENAVFGWAQGRKLQEIAGGFLGSRVKNATQLSQERCKQKTHV